MAGGHVGDLEAAIVAREREPIATST